MKRAINIAIFAVVLIALLFGAHRITRRDDSERKYGVFFKDKDPDAYDVLFFGTSHVLNDVLPMELWREYGITSYNMGNNSEPLGVTEWVLKVALEYHRPKVAVFDIFYIDRPLDLQWTYAFRHLFLDAVPLSPIKLEMLKAVLPSRYWGEYLVPFALYHGRWDEMITGNFSNQVESIPAQMGAEFRLGRAVPQAFVRTDEVYDGELPGTEALRSIAQICRENGIQPVFICLPSPATREEQMNCNTVYALAGELDVPFLNMLDVDGLVDFDTDCYDSFSHLNPDGAIKVTSHLGQWLRDSFDLEDRRGDSRFSLWDELLPVNDALFEAQWGEMTLVR